MSIIKRREAMKLLGAAAATHIWSAGAFAQARKKVGFLYPGLTNAAASRLQAFREGLRSSGWGDERVAIDARFAESIASRNVELAQALVAAKVDVLSPISYLSVNAARAATRTTPIVAFDLETDPVGAGMAATLAHPGGNVTGVFFDFPDFSSKWMELLKEAIPRLSKLAVVRDPATASPQLKGVQDVAERIAVRTDIFDIRSIDEFEQAFRSIGERRLDAVLILSSPLFGTNPSRVAEQTIRNRLPAITLFPEFARVGGLMAYGVDLLGAFRQAGAMAGKVLSGANPADLPIERPTKFELVVNARTAKSLGLELPASILVRADEVIE